MKIIKYNQTSEIINELKKRKQTIVLVGGCFDLLHIGHIKFLKSAKKIGNKLIVALESDKKVADLKGANRPIHTQKDRAEILSSLEFVDFVILLPYFTNNNQYDSLVKLVKPEIIAVSKQDINLKYKNEQMNKYGGKIVEVCPIILTHSTSKLAKLLKLE